MENTRIFSEEMSNRVEDIWLKNSPQIYKLCSQRSDSKEVADDLFQEVALKFCKSALNLDLDNPLWPWLKTVTVNTLAEIYRRNSRIQPLSVLMDEQAAYDILPAQSSVHFQNDLRERKANEVLRSFMQVLNPEETLVTQLTFLGGYDLKAVSRILVKTKNRLCKIRRSAMQKMREQKQKKFAILEKMDAPTILLEDLLTGDN